MNEQPIRRAGTARSAGTRFGSAALCAILALAGCDDGQSSTPVSTSAGSDGSISLPAADQRLCTGVVVLIDTSGSMADSVRGSEGTRRPKHLVARDALQRIIQYTGDWKQAHPDRVLQLGLYKFSSSAAEVLAMGEFDPAAARAAADRIPPPAGGTAIGDALLAAFQALYQSGCTRKYVVCVTDGENTSGPPPDRVARQLFAQTEGEVEIHFVAFDTSPRNFGFLSEVNGFVVEAADGEQLHARLTEIYEHRILAEAMPAEK